MSIIKAKSVVTDKFWILQQDDVKVGEVIQVQTGKYEVNLLGQKTSFSTLDSLKKSTKFTFVDFPKDAELTHDVEGYPTDVLAYNTVWNLKHNLPLYTPGPNSKSWHAAGYYKVVFNDNVIIQFCPKLISLQRYKYEGPFRSDPTHANFTRMFK